MNDFKSDHPIPLVPINPTRIRSLGGTGPGVLPYSFCKGNEAPNAAPATATDELKNLLREVITEDLQVEDRLNDEVKMRLQAFSNEFNRGEADYHKMFTMVKRKLVQERGLIL